ncbi:hypothetical protein D0Z03_001961 [Geotrichum reessii]|nr:hypothetical protein D0Z03_001961 [Galactomyces reessii]
MAKTEKKSVTIKEESPEPTSSNKTTPVAEEKKSFPKSAPTFRVITGSYEHNLLCVSVTLYPEAPVFTPVFHFTPHTQSIRCLAQSKRYLTSGSNDEHIRIYDLQKRKELGTLLHHDGSITRLEFFDNKWLLSASDDGKICIWRTKDWEVLGELQGHKAGGINDLSIHPSGRIAISAGNDHTLRLWNLMTARKASVLKLKKDVALRCRWSPDGTAFVLGFDRKVVVYSAATSEPTGRVLKLKSPLQHMEMLTLKGVEYVVTSHSDGSIIFYPLDQITEEVKTEDSEELTTAKLPDSAFKVVGHAVRVKNFSFFHYEPTDVIYMSSVSSDGNLVIWDLNTRDQVAVYNTGDRLNCCVMVSEDVEHYEEMKKRARLDDVSEAEETDFSEAESEPEIKEELTANQKKKSKKRLSKAKKAAMSKKPKLTVELS